jgi:cysteinyl-tRNA synthetase
VDYSEDSFHEAKFGLNRFYSTLNAIQEELEKPTTFTPSLPSPSKGEGAGGGSPVIENCRQAIDSFPAQFEEAMDEDFNTAEALGYFYDLQRNLNSLLDMSKGHPTKEVVSLLKRGLDYLSNMGWVFGLFRDNPASYIDRQKKEGINKLGISEEEILKSIEERNLTRKEKNYKRADEIRNDLLAKGIILEDTPAGTLWKIK